MVLSEILLESISMGRVFSLVLFEVEGFVSRGLKKLVPLPPHRKAFNTFPYNKDTQVKIRLHHSKTNFETTENVHRKVDVYKVIDLVFRKRRGFHSCVYSFLWINRMHELAVSVKERYTKLPEIH